MTAAMNADRQYFSSMGFTWYEWGLGGGADPGGYSANSLTDNEYRMVSPHIVGGYIPLNQSLKYDLEAMIAASWRYVYQLPDGS